MYYGHGSSLFVVVILGFFVLRMVMSRRRRTPGGGPYGGGGGPYGRGPNGGGPYGGGPHGHRDDTSTGARTETTADPDLRSGSGDVDRTPAKSSAFGQSGVPAGWMPDPSGKHQQRYWSGTAWTEHVVTDGVPGTDPLPEHP